MRCTRIAAILLAGFLALSGFAARQVVRAGEAGPYVPQEVIAALQPGADAHAVAVRAHLQILAGLPDTASYLMETSASDTVDAAVSALSGDPAVRHAEPNYRVGYLEAHPATLPHFDADGGPSPYVAQYALNLIRAPQAWAISGGQGVTVAVLDTGADLTHPMLAGRLAPGADFIDSAGTPADVATHVDSDGDGVYDAAWGHGTHVAGIVALVAPQARIMPVKVLDSDGMGTVFSVVQGIYYAVDHGARVINMSLGMDMRSGAIGDALHYAVAHGAVPVAAVGDGDLPNASGSPAADAGVVAVTATNAQDQKASFSDYGAPVNLSAPGVDIYSLFPGGGYATWSGTSMATPFASGEAALILALHPDWTTNQVESRMFSAVQPIDALNPDYAGELGRGRIDLALAVQASPGVSVSNGAARGSGR